MFEFTCLTNLQQSMNFLGYIVNSIKNITKKPENVGHGDTNYNKVLIQTLMPTKFLGNDKPCYSRRDPCDLYCRDLYKLCKEQKSDSFVNTSDNIENWEEHWKQHHKKQLDIENRNKLLREKLHDNFDRFIYFREETQSLSKNIRIDSTNSFLGAFLDAYNYHGDIVLSPDDIWIAISLYVSKYIDDNAETLRKKFVMHDGKIKLTVVEKANSLSESIALERKWDYFFVAMCEQIKLNTVEGVVDDFVCDFSTTKPVHQRISTAIIMNSFKKYFEYGRMICGCGIGNVYFEGTRDDWVKLKSKLVNLSKYFVDMKDGTIQKYIQHVGIILDNFVSTYDGKPDVDFWNTIASTRSVRIGSGGATATYVKGWILHFFGIYSESDVDSIPDYNIDVPVTLYNEFTQETKLLKVFAKFVSSSCAQGLTNTTMYKPDIGMCIFHPNEQV